MPVKSKFMQCRFAAMIFHLPFFRAALYATAGGCSDSGNGVCHLHVVAKVARLSAVHASVRLCRVCEDGNGNVVAMPSMPDASDGCEAGL